MSTVRQGEALRMILANRLAAVAVASTVAAALAPIPRAEAWQGKVLHDFCCDRTFSNAGLLLDSSGNLYGTGEYDGAHHKGTAFKLTFNAKTQQWTYAVLHDFCSETGCIDGEYPRGGLIVDIAGNVYGTAELGGNTNYGVAFEITAAGKYKVLYSFCPDGQTCSNGGSPVGTLTYAGAAGGEAYDGTSPLYGAGGTSTGGAIFELKPKEKSGWTAKMVYVLGSENGTSCYTDVVSMDASGNLIGTTPWCGTANLGTAFMLHYDGQQWTETANVSLNANYRNPRGNLVEDSKGRLFGVAQYGGNNATGVVFRLIQRGNTFAVATLHTLKFNEGVEPEGGLIMDRNGNLYGTALTGGGREAAGTVFKLNGAKNFQVLYTFCLKETCDLGTEPISTVVRDGAGNLFGMTTQHGANGYGTVFELSP